MSKKEVHYQGNDFEFLTESAVLFEYTDRQERGRKVYYEIYIDSLLLVNFVMNLYCLELVNLMFLRTATRRNMIGGAAAGAVLYLFPFLVPGEGFIKLIVFFPMAAIVMILITFRIEKLANFLRIFGLLFMCSFILGGSMVFLFRLFPVLEEHATGILGVMGMGTMVFWAATYLLGKSRHPDICKVELIGKGSKVTVNALVDSGNSLIEPLSGQPVCILEKSVFEKLWSKGRPEGFRAIPYHSIGKNNGILYGYLIPEIHIRGNGPSKICKDIYVGVLEEKLSVSGEYCMIVNPLLVSGGRKQTG